ncbi:MAG: signal peptide peptidase SppA [Candidatus Tectomicrobia bacterium]|nr:signal peptide peptidase SppA [Candidatus Tectomicrobia bacterium]
MRRRLPLGVLLSVLAFLAVAAGVWGLSQILVRSLLLEPETDGASRAVGVLRIQGGIFDARGTVRALERLTKRPEVKAVLIRIESPGGAVAPTQEIYEEVLRLRRSGLKVVASMGGVAASGGYYVAAAADKIYANPGTITGSIGVVMVLPNVERVLGAVGLQVNVIKSGPGKDVASPFRAMTDRDREILQRVVDDTYSQFVRAVAEGRKMPGERVHGGGAAGWHPRRAQAHRNEARDRLLGPAERHGPLVDGVVRSGRGALFGGRPGRARVHVEAFVSVAAGEPRGV